MILSKKSITLYLFIYFSMIFSQIKHIKVENIINQGKIQNDEINEASGIVASRQNRGLLYINNDSGDSAKVYVIDYTGKDLGFIKLKGQMPNDCEDIAIGNGIDKNSFYIYLGDIGDNGKKHNIHKIYRFKEPDLKNTSNGKIKIENFEIIYFKYPNNERYDAETLMCDPISGDIYIITKRGKNEYKENDIIFKLGYQDKYENTFVVKKVGELSIPVGDFTGYGAVGGDISFAGNGTLIKTYTTVFYWNRKINETIENALKRKPKILPYAIESQGESICWRVDDSGYFTTSEERASEAYLIYYPIKRWK